METTKLITAFEQELNLTEQGFIDLKDRKEGLIIDVSTEAGFKAGRKERSEQNAVLKNIDRLAIDGKKSIDEARNDLKLRVSEIYKINVLAFEQEDERRKEEKRKAEAVEAERIRVIKEEIDSIKSFADDCTGKTSDEISSIIEAVDLIDVFENFAEFTQDAQAVKKETQAILSAALSSAIQNERLESERAQMRAQERLNKLMMIPVELMGKSSSEIQRRIDSIANFEVKESEFLTLTQQAISAASNVISQLKTMLTQQKLVEEAEVKQSEIAPETGHIPESKKMVHEQNISIDEIHGTDYPDFTMSMYSSELELYKDKANFYERKCSELNQIINNMSKGK